ncbi:MAG: carbamoyltransferase [Saprospiraceae bacterium]|nr:carbamoyltransferase [Saprospiraceae bacterium]MCF8252845.1 carbamoyltransferase [Saprospiraceae bacterium]MCF8283287.1 carbamoyltransferase [Bacteroidales bacterium]MCF8314400.1 carbamoyltransferase [Saprospiraceae bacterium]MCF8443284.1 carbamoyltransferase [Saprospiraceae bacterium]
MKILGISAFYHDSAAAVLHNGEVIAAAQEERFTRKKHDPDFPTNAARFCLEHAGFTIDELDAVVFYDKPLLKFERLLDTYYGFAPKGIASFIKAIPVWLREKMFLKKIIHEELAKVGDYDKRQLKLLFPEHHLSHAASAFYPSGFEEAAILTLDGVGEWATASICYGKGRGIEILRELHFPHSLGLLYSAFTYFLGFRVNSGEYKLMGLAPYGRPNAPETARFKKIIETELVDIKPDGSIWLDQKYFSYATGLRMVRDDAWAKLFGFPRRTPEQPMEQHHCDLALAIQQVTEEVVILMAQEAKRLTGAKYLCMAGGVALNCVANGKLLRSNIFEKIFIQPAAGDAGGALGAALAAHHLFFKQERKLTAAMDDMKGTYLGPEFSWLDVEQAARKYKARFTKYDDFGEMAERVAALIAEGNVIGWVQGRMEFGPRALGARSIIGDARNEEMQRKLNLKIKYRESFRPFAPSVLAEDAEQFFDLDAPSPYMLLVADISEGKKASVPPNYLDLPMMERLYVKRSDLQAITHVDFSARVQTVHRETNPRYHLLIEKFKEKTGCPVIVNTSFNVRGEPIVCTPDDAYRCFMRTEMDYLVVGDYLFAKTDQPEWTKTDNWQEEFVLD